MPKAADGCFYLLSFSLHLSKNPRKHLFLKACTGCMQSHSHSKSQPTLSSCPRRETLVGQHPALQRVLCGAVAAPTGVAGTSGPGTCSSPMPGFLPDQVTEFHGEEKRCFCSLLPAVCQEHSDLLSHQNIRRSPWQAPLCFQRLEGGENTCEMRTFLGTLGCADSTRKWG